MKTVEPVYSTTEIVCPYCKTVYWKPKKFVSLKDGVAECRECGNVFIHKTISDREYKTY